MPPVRAELSAGEARRLAVAAQGLGKLPSAAGAGRRRILTVVERLGALQIDSVNVLARAHYLPLFSRLGSYDREHLDTLAYGRRPAIYEAWSHAASYVPVDLQPEHRWRYDAWRARRGRPERAEELLAHVRQHGPTAASDLESRSGGSSWWNWSSSKRALESLFGQGELAVARRRTSFEREFDLPERVLPAAVLEAPTPTPLEAHQTLLLRAARLLGVATAGDLRDVFRLRGPVARDALLELVGDGRLERVAVQGWREPAYLMPGTAVPRRVTGAALLAPFDPLVYHRPRVERLWGLRMRLEIYVPADRRVLGYYVLPFLLGDQLAAQLDLKADRKAGELVVAAAHRQPRADSEPTAAALAPRLHELADWLGLDTVTVLPRGGLAPALASAITQ